MTQGPLSVRSPEVSCGQSIGGHEPEQGRYVLSDNVVALPAIALQAVPLAWFDEAAPSEPSDPTVDRSWYWAKEGLVVRGGHRAEIRVPADYEAAMRIGWAGQEPGTVAIVDCPGEGGWFAFAGGYWVQEPGCYPVEVSVDGGPALVHQIGIGSPCPGQDPPPVLPSPDG